MKKGCGLPNNETITLQNCFDLGVLDCSNVQIGTLQWDLYLSGTPFTLFLFWLTLFVFCGMILGIELALLVSFLELLSDLEIRWPHKDNPSIIYV